VDAFERLQTDVQLVMAGASSYCDEYSRELRRHASDRIRMLDWVSGETLDELLTNAMIFVLPSDLEGLSLALLDAMGAGLCVLTSDVPENREVVDGTGFTFQRGNAADLAERMKFPIANPAVREAAHLRGIFVGQNRDGNRRGLFDVRGWKQPQLAAKRHATRVALAPEIQTTERQAG
jgi:glycosyltransferase involved in cell wall biosynthesis